MRLLGCEAPRCRSCLPVTLDAMADRPTPSLYHDRRPHLDGGRRPRRTRSWPYAAHRHPDLRRGGDRDPPGGGRRCPAIRRSRSTTPTASRSISPSRWPTRRGSSVDEAASGRLMGEQRERARRSARREEGPAGRGRPSHRRTLIEPRPGQPISPATTTSSARDGCGDMRSRSVRPVEPRARRDEIELVLDRTPFYAEGGGQLAETRASSRLDNGAAHVEVLRCPAPIPGLIVHQRAGRARRVVARRSAPRRGGRRRAPRLDLPVPHCDPHGAQGFPARRSERPRPRPARRTSPGRFRFDFSATGGGARLGPGSTSSTRVNAIRVGRPRRTGGDHDPGGCPVRSGRWRSSARSTAGPGPRRLRRRLGP